MPNLAELSSMLSPFRALALEGAVEAKSKFYQDEVRARSLHDAPSQFTAFVIPLDSHLPLPEAFGVTNVSEHEASITLAHQAALETKIGTKELTTILSSLVVGLGDQNTHTPLAELDEYTIMANYRKAIEIANQTIMAYKLTPGRHNHDLQPVTVPNRPSYVDMFRFDTTTGQIIEAGNLHMHQNLLASVTRADLLGRAEQAEFMHQLRALSLASDDPARHIVATIFKAIDNVCVGDYTSGLVNADTYTEHFMRYALSRMYVSKNNSEEVALSKVNHLGSMDKLLGGLAVALSMERSDLKKQISFDAWRVACREKRNHITHRFTKLPVEPGEARTALRETIRMNTMLNRIIMYKNADLVPTLQVFEAPRQYLGSIEDYDANDARALSRVNDIIAYKYHLPKA